MNANMLEPLPRTPIVDTSRSPHVRLRPLPLDAVKLADDFWEPRRRNNREVTLPSQYRHLKVTGLLDNFRRASGKVGGEYQGIYFNDSDVYKWLEAAAWTLAEGSDPELERMVDTAITEVEAAQRPDGYLNTYFTFEKAAERWTDFDLHEMYCRIALMRGPLLYCAEQTDNPGVDLRDLALDDARFSARFDPEMLGGVVVLQAEARSAAPDCGWEDRLYRTVASSRGRCSDSCHPGNRRSLLRLGQPRAWPNASLA
ncbi:MAG TPA: beta-L-arabinofuranosidase domain-containing protein, partial [Rubrobacter sp.]|nr:beta-L-arabinofuranosidase domain-containing protein [Rubrobacter sp.]